jgi:hypothetical protein
MGGSSVLSCVSEEGSWPRIPDPWCDDSLCCVTTPLSTINGGDGMTVLVGAISETCEVALASDSLQCSKSGQSAGGFWKTLRINNHCAIGFSGSGTCAGQVAANFMGKPEWAREAGSVDILRRIEEAGIQRPDWSCAGAAAIMNRTLFDLASIVMRRLGNLPDVSVVLVGKEGANAYLRKWVTDIHAADLWVITTVEGSRFDEAQMMAFGPESISGPKALIKDTALPLGERILGICELFASRFPEKVNRDFSIRTDGSSFARISLGTGQH